MTLLQIKNLSHYFGGLLAVDNLNEEIREGELIGLIGPNGAGKTTVFNLITGVYRPSQGVSSSRVRAWWAKRRIRSTRWVSAALSRRFGCGI